MKDVGKTKVVVVGGWHETNFPCFLCAVHQFVIFNKYISWKFILRRGKENRVQTQLMWLWWDQSADPFTPLASKTQSHHKLRKPPLIYDSQTVDAAVCEILKAQSSWDSMCFSGSKRRRLRTNNYMDMESVLYMFYIPNHGWFFFCRQRGMWKDYC